MSRFAIASGVLISFFVARTTLAETNVQPETKVIPLKDIWAYQMPGTRDVRDLEPDKFGPSISKRSSAEQIAITGKSLTSQIVSHLEYKRGQSAKQAFAVAGTGVDALREASAVLSGKKKPQTLFPANSSISVVFFSRLYGSYVHLNNVEQQPGLIIITFRFVPHETAQLTRHFALIPLGKLPPGEVRVDINRSPTEPPSSMYSQIVAQPFRFTVKGKSD